MASLTASSTRSAFAGKQMAFRPASNGAPRMAPAVRRTLVSVVEASKVCELTGKKRNKANAVSFSNKKNRKWQEPNLQAKKFFWAHGQRWVSLRVCTKAIKTIEKNGLDIMAQVGESMARTCGATRRSPRAPPITSPREGSNVSFHPRPRAGSRR